LTFFGVKVQPSAYLCVRVLVETKALSLGYLDPAHQALIDRILGLKEGGLNCRQIAAYLNDQGVTSWTGKRFYPELVFGVLRKAKLKVERLTVATLELRVELVIN
jgi:hypothetical protein